MSKFLFILTFTSLVLSQALLSSCLLINPEVRMLNQAEKQALLGFSNISSMVEMLPVGFHSEAVTQGGLKKNLLANASPKPIDEQTNYLFLEGQGAERSKHYFRLDERHLLVCSISLDITEQRGDPLEIEIYLWQQDSTWKKVTSEAIPEWATFPNKIEFLKPETPQAQIRIEATHAAKRKQETFQWQEGKLQAVTSSTSS